MMKHVLEYHALSEQNNNLANLHLKGIFSQECVLISFHQPIKTANVLNQKQVE